MEQNLLRQAVAKCLPTKPRHINTLICMEELSELQKAISKRERYGATTETISNLLEEMADVEIVIEMLKQTYHITDAELKEEIKRKMDRNLANIEV